MTDARKAAEMLELERTGLPFPQGWRLVRGGESGDKFIFATEQEARRFAKDMWPSATMVFDGVQNQLTPEQMVERLGVPLTQRKK